MDPPARRANAEELGASAECPLHRLVGISFKCQIVHLERVTRSFVDLPGECQSSATNLGMRRPGGGGGRGGDVGSQMTRSCCSLPVFCLLNKPVVFILWKNLTNRFPVLALERLRTATFLHRPPPHPPTPQP